MNSPTVRHPDDLSLIAFNLGTLDDSRSAEINRHLKNCQSCRRRLVALPAESEQSKGPPPLPRTARFGGKSLPLIAGGAGAAGIALLGVFLAWAMGAFHARGGDPVPVVGTTQPATTSQPPRGPAQSAPVAAREKSDAMPKERSLPLARAAETIARTSAVQEVSQKPAATVATADTPRSAGTLASSAAVASKPSPPLNDRPAEFFNGKDLTAWNGLPKIWHVEKGSIIGVPPADQTQSASLFSQRSYRDFDLKFQVSVDEGIGDCGVHFRSQLIDGEHGQVAGPLCTICGKEAPSGQLTGSLLTEPPTKVVRKAPTKLVERFVKPAVNHFHIRCQGHHILIEVNGIKTVNSDFPALPQEGLIAWTLSAARPPHKVTFKILRFVDLAGAPDHPTAERPAVVNSELLKAEIKFEKAMKAADENLLKHFDLEIQKLQRHGHGGDPALVAAVEHEKEVFQEKGLIPWSRPMRQPLLQYGKELAASRKIIGNAFESAIERAEKVHNEQQKEFLLNEAARVLAPRPVAIWELTDRGQTHREVFFSDGTYVHDNHQDESIARFWTPPSDDRIVLEYPDPNNASATMAWVLELTPDGNQMIALTKNGQKRFWQRVENE